MQHTLILAEEEAAATAAAAAESKQEILMQLLQPPFQKSINENIVVLAVYTRVIYKQSKIIALFYHFYLFVHLFGLRVLYIYIFMNLSGIQSVEKNK